MVRKQPKTPDQPAASGRFAKRLIAVVLTLAAVAGLVWGLSRLGDEARRGIGPRDRYAVRYLDIECNPPPGTDRAAFLAEVRYVSNLPDTFQSLDPDLRTKLTAAFVAHPWVAAVDDVTVDADGKVRAVLKHRAPALAVRVANGLPRVVDSTAVLLPVATLQKGLPELLTPVATPPGRDGQVWDDATVRRAVELVAAHQPRTLELTRQGWRLTTADGKALVVEK